MSYKSRGNWSVAADICKGCGRIKKFCKCKELHNDTKDKERVQSSVKKR